MSENFEKIKAAPLFFGIDEAELPELLEALDAHSRRYQKGEIIMPEGEKTDSLGLVMRGSVLIVQDDFWGNRNIMARITQGGIFAESFACTGEKLTVGAEAAEGRACARLVPEVVRRARKARRQSDIRARAQKSEFQLEARSHGQAHDARKADVISFGAGDEERKK